MTSGLLRSPDELPRLNASLPGTGGRPLTPEDFMVEEIPAYLPCGAGDHCMALVEKREMTTRQAIDRLGQALGVPAAAIGYAGLKDKHAVTRQWLSFPGVDPAALLRLPAAQSTELRVLAAERHRNKIKTGHLRGNRFTITLRELDPQRDSGAEHTTDADGDEAPAPLRLARAALAALAASGLPNFYGPQRFGADANNAERAARALRGEGALPRDKQQRRLLISALQSAAFNAALADRMTAAPESLLGVLLGGEVLQRRDSGGLFVSEDRAVDQQRLDAGEVVITGPICGPRMPLPKAQSPAAAREQAVLGALGLDPEDFARFGRLARGGRRPLTVPVSEPAARMAEPGALELRFALPAGAYATVLLREITGSSYPKSH